MPTPPAPILGSLEGSRELRKDAERQQGGVVRAASWLVGSIWGAVVRLPVCLWAAWRGVFRLPVCLVDSMGGPGGPGHPACQEDWL